MWDLILSVPDHCLSFYFGGDKILYLPSEGLLKSLHNFNPFWKSVFGVWAKFERFPITTPDKVMSQCIWLNNGRKFILSHWIQKGLYVINDLLTNDGKFLSFVEFRNLYLLDVNFIEYYGVINAIPLHWKRLIRNHNKIQNIIHLQVKLSKTCLKLT